MLVRDPRCWSIMAYLQDKLEWWSEGRVSCFSILNVIMRKAINYFVVYVFYLLIYMTCYTSVVLNQQLCNGYQTQIYCLHLPRYALKSVSPGHFIKDIKTSLDMMTSSNGNIFRVTGPLCGEFTCHQWIPNTKASDTELWCFSQRPVTQSFHFFFDLCLNQRLSKEWRPRWFEMPSRSLWRHCNGIA